MKYINSFLIAVVFATSSSSVIYAQTPSPAPCTVELNSPLTFVCPTDYNFSWSRGSYVKFNAYRTGIITGSTADIASSVVGVVTGVKSSNLAIVQTSGLISVNFDGSTTTGDAFVLSTTRPGYLHDSGSPTCTSSSLGILNQTISGVGMAQVWWAACPGGGVSVAPGTVNNLGAYTGTNTLGPLAPPLGLPILGNGIGINSSPFCTYASVQTGADAGTKIVAAIAQQVTAGGGCVVADFQGTQLINSLVTIPPTIDLYVGNAQFACNITPCVQVNEEAWLIGSGTSPGGNGTQFNLANGLNGDVILVEATGGPTAWTHSTRVTDVVVNGNVANNSAGNGIHWYQPGETAEMARVRSYNNAGDGFRIEGSLAGTWTFQDDSSFSNNGCGFNFYNVSSTAKVISSGGDNNLGGGFCILPAAGGIFSMAILNGKLETGARGTDPAILIDGTNSPTLLTVVNLLTNTAGVNFIEVVNDTPTKIPSVIVIGSKVSYTNLYNDVGNGVTIPFSSVSNGTALNFWDSGGVGPAAFQSIAFPHIGLTPANGTNENLCLGPAGASYAGFARLTGNTAPFSIGGLTCQGSSSDGRLLILENTTAQVMTINNQDTGSTVGNRITTQTGANVVLPAGPSGAVLLYDKTTTSWLMMTSWPLAASNISGLPTFPSGAIVGTTDTQILTNKSVALSEITPGSTGAGTYSFAGATAAPLPSVGGAAPTVGGDIRFDSNQQATVAGGNGSLTGSLTRLVYWAHPVSDIICAHGGDTSISPFSYGATNCNNTAGTDAVTTPIAFTSQATLPSGFMVKDKMLRIIWQFGEWTNTTTAPLFNLKGTFGASTIYSSSNTTASASLTNRAVTMNCLIIANGSVSASAAMTSDCVTSIPGGSFGVSANTVAPLLVATNTGASLSLGIVWAATGLFSGTYTSGITATGTVGQTCTLTAFNNGNTAGTATVALTGTNTIAGGTALVITNTGYASTTAATSATAGSGTATCSGTATVSTVLGGAQDNALQLHSVTVEELN